VAPVEKIVNAKEGRTPFINVVTKSGTNTLHGSGFLLYRQKDLQANVDFLKRQDLISIANSS